MSPFHELLDSGARTTSPKSRAARSPLWVPAQHQQATGRPPADCSSPCLDWPFANLRGLGGSASVVTTLGFATEYCRSCAKPREQKRGRHAIMKTMTREELRTAIRAAKTAAQQALTSGDRERFADECSRILVLKRLGDLEAETEQGRP